MDRRDLAAVVSRAEAVQWWLVGSLEPPVVRLNRKYLFNASRYGGRCAHTSPSAAAASATGNRDQGAAVGNSSPDGLTPTVITRIGDAQYARVAKTEAGADGGTHEWVGCGRSRGAVHVDASSAKAAIMSAAIRRFVP